MPHSVLSSVALGYQPLWDSQRALCGVQLSIDTDSGTDVDAQHLLQALNEVWSDQSPTLLLSIQSVRLLDDVLAHATPHGPWIEVAQTYVTDASVAQKIKRAHARDLKLVWRGEPGQRPDAALSDCFVCKMVGLSPQEAVQGLRTSQRWRNASHLPSDYGVETPRTNNRIFDNVASQALADHCLDDEGAWAVTGWPGEDVLYHVREPQLPPDADAVLSVIQAVDEDASLDTLEHLLGNEPVLIYRLLRLANSAGTGMRADLQSIRHGLMVMGYSQLRRWLTEQLSQSTRQLNLRPVRQGMVLRARIMEQMLDVGETDALRRELFLCGLLSQIDLMLGESLSTALSRIPLPRGVYSAIQRRDGPYLPYLEMAAALESTRLNVIANKCRALQLNRESVNRALLRALAQANSFTFVQPELAEA